MVNCSTYPDMHVDGFRKAPNLVRVSFHVSMACEN